MNTETSPGVPRIDRCWNEIGVWGNQSCAELPKATHCHNCPVFSRAGRSLFDQAPPPSYLEEWTRLLSDERREEAAEQHSVMVFRLGREWLALETKFLREVAEKRVIHKIPHRTNQVLLGLVNIRGGLQLCISLQHLLGLGEEEPGKTAAAPSMNGSAARLAVLEKDEVCWVCPVNEIMGIHRLPAAQIEQIPVTVAKASASFTRGIFTWNEKRIGYLDHELVFYHLNRSLFR